MKEKKKVEAPGEEEEKEEEVHQRGQKAREGLLSISALQNSSRTHPTCTIR